MLTLCEINAEYENRFTKFAEIKYLPLLCCVNIKREYTLNNIPLHIYCVKPVLMAIAEGDTLYFELYK